MNFRGFLQLALVLTTLLSVAPVLAEESQDGKLLYQVHCLACHGKTAQGDGPMRGQLEMSVPDLTIIASENDGEFPTERVHETIDGRHETPAHGTRQMPVWGFTFQSSGRDSAQEEEVREMIEALTDYLKTLQVGTSVAPASQDSED